MSTPNPRKRAAPGANPVVPLQQMQQAYSTPPPDQLLLWNAGMQDPNNFMSDMSRNTNSYAMNGQNQYTSGIQQPTTTIARRQPNRALVPTGPRAGFDATSDSWGHYGDDNLLPGAPSAGLDENEDIDLLEERAQIAKREAQAKRKAIPPFVQKLSSFLHQEKNTDLIRWSDNGDSFIVLDEDEFAKTLIPELFKHNNYPSFVRQLNMYGFHKRVGLSDNSMKASERKNKSPSEYHNPYFRRGHPNLLWLINKPKSGNKSTKKGKKEDGDADSDEEVGNDDSKLGQGLSTVTSQPAPGGELGQLQRKDLQVVRDQLSSLQSQQKAISALITRLRSDHNALYQQALMFQNMHERHETSINAILQFLANVFRKQLEEQGGAQNVSELLASIIPNAQMPQGSVVDLGDFIHQQVPTAAAMSPHRRAQRLLPPIPGQGKASMASPGPKPSPMPYGTGMHEAQMGSVTELLDTPTDTSSPNYLSQDLQSNPREGMMNLIRDTNTNAGPPPAGIDLPEMAANTPTSLNNDQRNKVLSMMSGQRTPQPGASPAPVKSNASQPGSSVPNAAAAAAPSTSLSPILSSIPRPSINEIKVTRDELDAVQRMQEEQNAKLDQLNQILAPLSPSGRLESPPTFFDESYFNDPQYNNINFDDPINDGSDFNFTLYDSDSQPGLAPEGQGMNNTPSPAITEEIPRDDLATSPTRDAKRRRMG